MQDTRDRLSEEARWLLISDADGTLLGDDDALRDFAAALRIAPHVEVVIDSSRPISSVAASLAELNQGNLAIGVIGALGTEIELSGQRLRPWEKRFEGWDRDPIDRAMGDLGFPAHADEYQTALKASYDVPRASRSAARAAVERSGVLSRVIESGDLNFDVIPRGAGKEKAAIHVAEALHVPVDRLITAGDSANDADLLRLGRGIVVAGASDELTSLLNGHGAFWATRTHAAGVLEGLRHHGAPI